MDLDGFWSLLERTRPASAADAVEAVEEQAQALRRALEALPDDEVRAFDGHLRTQVARANDWKLWAAGYLAAGGMSDDAFEYFRVWLVHQGREVFERVLPDPDQLATLLWDDEGEAFGEAELLAYVPLEVLEERGADAEPESDGELLRATTGERFPENDDEWFAATFPRLWERVDAARADALAEPDAPAEDRWDRITEADVAAFLDSTPMAKEPRPVAPMRPVLAAALYQRGDLRGRDRPMLAAHWLVDGLDGEALRELAGLSGDEWEVGELWPRALEEVGVTLPVTHSRVVMAWAAGRVVRGERDARWLVRFLWPDHDETENDPALDQLIYTIDDDLDWTERDLRSKRREELQRAEAARRAVDACIAAMARDDVAGAERALREWER